MVRAKPIKSTFLVSEERNSHPGLANTLLNMGKNTQVCSCVPVPPPVEMGPWSTVDTIASVYDTYPYVLGGMCMFIFIGYSYIF